jgi:outer membrane receptor protein involved in Fe transport
LQEVIVTATKQAENIQNVPVTVTAVTQAALENQNIQNFRDFALQMPQIQYESNGGAPGEGCITLRGIAGCGFGFGGEQSSAAVYLDEQPITTPDGEIEWHMYDINRVEVLPGPQGTLYGASSEAGTVRYITNKPDPSHFSAGYTGQINTIYNGTLGGLAEGFVNVPFSDKIAVRLVGWYERDSGYINNVYQKITFLDGSSIDNAKYVQNHYNPITTAGGRAMFTFKINDDWSINPTIGTQKQTWNGVFGTENWKAFGAAAAPAPGLTVSQFNAETAFDSTVNYTLTVLGKIGNFNITFASGYNNRHKGDYLDYVDYTLAYESYYDVPTCPGCWPKKPIMYRFDGNHYEYLSNELRIASPTEWKVHFIAGLYYDRAQGFNFLSEPIPGLNPTYQVGYGTNFVWRDTVYLDDLESVFRNWAAFIQANWDITDKLTFTAGFRRYRYDNTIKGFYGYSAAYGHNVFDTVFGPGVTSGEQICTSSYRFNNAPCTDEDQRSEAWGSVPLFTLSYKITPDFLVYGTFSKGYRPGGPNRVYGTLPYLSDYITNYEIGWKTSWFDHHLIFNGDVYWDDWKNYQFTFTGANGIGVVANAGSAASKGFEGQLQWLVTSQLHLTANVEYTDAHLTANYCGALVNGKPVTSNPCIVPGTAPFSPLSPNGYPINEVPLWKFFLSARYTMPLGNGSGFIEGDQSYQSWMWFQQEPGLNAPFGQIPGYGITNFSLGYDKDNWELELIIENAFNRLAITDYNNELQAAAAGVATYNIIAKPRLIGLQFSQHF